MFKLETHDNSEKYFKELYIEKDSMHISTMSSLSELLLEKNPMLSEKDEWRITYIEDFIKKIYPSWKDILNNVALKIELRNIIQLLKDSITSQLYLNELEYFEENLDAVLKDIIYIVECGVDRLQNYKNTIQQKIFKVLFTRLTENQLFKEISREVLEENSLVSFEKRIEGWTGDRIKKIYFYNFNSINVQRYILFNKLRRCGYEVIFRIPYFNGLNKINKCWVDVYKDNSKLKDLFIWENSNSERDFSEFIEKSRFISFVEGQKKRQASDEQVSIRTYYEVSDFIRDNRNKEVITFNKDSIRECFNYYEMDKNHCYQTDIGRFLYYLYDCKVENDDIKMDYKTYFHLITSGWIDYRGWNGSKLAEYLIKNSDYFSNVESINEIILRINKLKEIDEVNEIFENAVEARVKKDNLKKFLSNPFRAFGYLNFEEFNITLNYFEQCTLRLKRFLLRAFEGKSGLINYKNHMEMLKIAFRNEYIIEQYNLEENKWFLSKIWAALHYEKIKVEFIHKEEMRALFNVLLSNEFKEDEKKLEKPEFSIDQLEGLLLRNKITNTKLDKRYLHLADMSYKSYEEYLRLKKFDKGILDLEDIKFLIINNLNAERKQDANIGIWLQEKSKSTIDNYLKFSIGNIFINYNGRKVFSWIKGIRDNDSKSILYKQLENLYGDEEQVKNQLDFVDYVDEEALFNRSTFTKNVNKLVEKHKYIPEVAYRDLDFCEDKFLYSSLLSYHPVYFTDFHHKLLLSILISTLKNSIENSFENIAQYILPLFPQWTSAEKYNILSVNFGSKNLREYKLFEGINYPKDIDKLYILRSKYMVTERNKIRNRYNDGNMRTDKIFKEFLDVYLSQNSYNRGQHCRMCPYIFLCGKGEFVIESKRRI